MSLGAVYLAVAALTQVLAVIAEKRKGAPWSQAAVFLIVWPLGLMWPFVICGLTREIFDGAYKPRHRASLA